RAPARTRIPAASARWIRCASATRPVMPVAPRTAILAAVVSPSAVRSASAEPIMPTLLGLLGEESADQAVCVLGFGDPACRGPGGADPAHQVVRHGREVDIASAQLR